MMAARLWFYLVVGLFFAASVIYARGPGLVLVIAVFLWSGLMWAVSGVIIGKFGLVNGGMLVHAMTAFGILLLSTWNFVAAVHERRRERNEQELARRVAAALEAAAARAGAPGWPPRDEPDAEEDAKR
jgi:hypothetical protein